MSVKVTVPPFIVRGHTGHLRCDYNTNGQPIYAVKWYKNSHEFYRYKPGLGKPLLSFPVDGFIVNVSTQEFTWL